jgi:hypothetical protein
MRCSRLALIGLAAVVGLASGAHADEPLFGYVYATDTLPKGQKEVELWSTNREGRSQGDFHLWEQRTEFSYGLTDNIQLSGYLNIAHANVFANTPSGDTVAPEAYADYEVDPTKRFDRWRYEGVSAEALWRIRSPYTQGLGVALYAEPTIGPNTRELELRLILQKNFLQDRLVFAGNATVGYEVRKIPGDPAADPDSKDFVRHWDHESDLNLGLGASYRFRSNWAVGAEFLNERELAGLTPFEHTSRTNVAWYVGPNIHFGGRKVFATATFLAQLPWAQDHANPPPGLVVDGITNGDDFEKYRLRIKVGTYF